MSSADFDRLYRRYQDDLESELRRYVPAPEGILGQFYGMLRYHLGWTDESFNPVNSKSGKRLRPTLCLAACEGAGGDYHRALPAAAALELLHNYSLIHDDIEDRSTERRHRPTVWKIWGEALAINAGDGLYTLARIAILDLPRAGVDLETTVAAANLFDQTCLSLCEGQHLDMAFETMPDVTSQLYYEMIGKKTAELFATSTQIGALVAAGDVASSAPYREFGYSLGLAFQIQDDILGIWGAADVTGKGATDIYQRKKTLPVIAAVERASKKDRATLLHLYQQPSLDDEQVAQILEILNRSDARRLAEAEAQRHYRAALNLLTGDRLGQHDVSHLRTVAEFLIGRKS